MTLLQFILLWLGIGAAFSFFTEGELPCPGDDNHALYFIEGTLAWPVRVFRWYYLFFSCD